MTYLTRARAVAYLAATSIAALTISEALAQQQPAAPRPAAPAPQRPAAGAPRPAQPAQTQPAQPQQAQPAQPGQQAEGAPAAPLLYSQWVKICVGADGQPVDQKNAAAKAQQLCVTAIEVRRESGEPVAAVAALEPPADGKKFVRLTLPVGMALRFGTRVIVDNGQPATSPFETCFANACIADYELTTDFIDKLKKGKTAVVQAIRYDNNPISVQVPLAEFAKAFTGPPSDPKVMEEQQKKLEDELKRKSEDLQKKANELRQKLEQKPQ